MRVLVSGSTGLIGAGVIDALRHDGHEPCRIVRAAMNSDEPEVIYNIAERNIDLDSLAQADAVIHLAGENIAGLRWTEAKKRSLWESRIGSTETIVKGLCALDDPPKILLNASAIGFYGSQGDDELTESSPPGKGFLAELCQAWEAATQPARDAGIRVVNLRFSVVVATSGGPIAQMLTPFKLGLGGVLGNGKQWFSWIARDDAVNAILFALDHESIEGPCNIAAPNPVTNRELTKTIGRAVHRPTIFPVPAPVVRTIFGELGDELMLASARVHPKKLSDAGFTFATPTFEAALANALQ